MLFPPDQPLAQPPRRVVVTGAGVVSALGIGWPVNAEGFRSGRIAFRPVTLFDVSRQRVKTAAEVDLPRAMPPTRLTGKMARRLDRASQMLLLAAHEAWTQSGWESSDDLPLVLGTTAAGMSLGEAYFRVATQMPHRHRHQPTRALHYQSQTQARTLASAFGFSGPITIISNACASGANAIGHAWELIRSGRRQRVLTGGYDALSQLVFAGFDSLQTLSPTLCRPFDASRDGLAIGEGAAMLTLETLDHARRRGAVVLGELIGYGTTFDQHHLTQPHPQGDAALAAMTLACQSARVMPEDIDYLNAHGTGTPLNDTAEALAIRRWGGPRIATLPVSSTKASVGHLLGGAGAVEAVVCLMTLREQWLPPEIAFETPDPACAFPVVSIPQDGRVNTVLSNSFGFGGVNASLVFRRWT
jgi:3-oxoacyl-[acyl-carrier-protein] synthase II